METINLLTRYETLMERSDDGTLYEIDSDKQHFGYRDIDSLYQHLETEWHNGIYDGFYDSDYEEWMFKGQTECFDDDGNYEGFERIFVSDDGKEVLCKIEISTFTLVD